MISKALAAFLMLAAYGCAQPAPAPAEPAADTSIADVAVEPLEIVTASGSHRFRVELADDARERDRGLMFRTVLPDDEGMIFQFERPMPLSFWMKNTLIPLDIIFIGADGRIVNIAENTTPMSLEPIPSTGPAIAVLEVRGGLTRELGVQPGDRVLHRILPRG